MAQAQATITNWPAWAHPAFALTGTHPVSKGTPAQRGMLAVAATAMVGNGLQWYCGNATLATGTCCGYHVGMLAYGIATVAFAKAGGKLRAAKCYAGIGPNSTPQAAAAQLAKAGFAPTIAVANGMFGTIANATAKGKQPLYLGALTATTGKATTGTVPNAYAGVPAAQAPKGYTLPKVAPLATGGTVAKARTPKAPKAKAQAPTAPVASPSTPAAVGNVGQAILAAQAPTATP